MLDTISYTTASLFLNISPLPDHVNWLHLEQCWFDVYDSSLFTLYTAGLFVGVVAAN